MQTNEAIVQSSEELAALYEHDFALWLATTAQRLKEQRFTELDLENLIEEIESMGRSQGSAVRSNLVIILVHLLKWKYQPDQRSRSWQVSLVEHRIRLDDEFQDSPSLRKYYEEVFQKCYQSACKQAAVETGLRITTFPGESPFTPEQVLDWDFLP